MRKSIALLFIMALVGLNAFAVGGMPNNPSFESGAPFPTGYTFTNRMSSGVLCTVVIAHTGNCALNLYGARTPVILKQALAFNPAPGQSVSLSIWAKWSTVRTGGYAQVRVFFTDATTQLININIPTSPATQTAYQLLTVTDTVDSSKTVQKAELWIGYTATAGSIQFDDVSIEYTP